jgi:tungstate transport system ATP-binding protein
MVELAEVLAIIGPNGAGKSTLLRIINLLEKPTKGEIYLDGERIGNSGILAERRKMAMVFQDPLLFNQSVFANVAYGLRARRLAEEEIKKKVGAILKKMKIDHLANKPSWQLSGGEAQRVSLARAMVIEPEVLFLDEPFTFLDPPAREAIRNDLVELVRQMNLTTVYVTHDRTEALIVADRIAVMDQGRILQSGSAFDVFNRPVNEAVADFVGVETVLSGKTVSSRNELSRVVVDGSEIEVAGVFPESSKVLLCIRPEEVTIEETGDEHHTSARNHFIGRVVDLVNMGALIKASLDCGFPLVSYITKQSKEDLGLEVGSKVKASFKASAVHVIRK